VVSVKRAFVGFAFKLRRMNGNADHIIIIVEK
jgi:hypothetical protein